MRPTASLLAAIALTSSLTATSSAQHGGVLRHCQPGAAGARLEVSGSASFLANGGSGDLQLHATGLPGSGPGLFFLGSGLTQGIPFGQGFLCVAGPLVRLGVVVPSGGAASFALDYLTPPEQGLIAPGTIWNFQYWFRSGVTFDLTDALQIAFGPPVPLAPAATIERGFLSGHALGWTFEGGIELVDDAAEWNAFWLRHTIQVPPVVPPPVDFTQDMVVAVFAGQRSSSGYSLIVRRLDLSVATLAVGTHETGPGAMCPVLAVITAPYHLVRVPRVERMAVGTWTRSFLSDPPCP